MLALAFVGLLHAPAFAAADEPRITVAMLPPGTEVGEIAAAVPEMAPGVMSAGLGRVPAAQTYLDIGQGNRVNERLYDSDLLPIYVREGQLEEGVWDRIVRRAEAASGRRVASS